MHSRPVSEEDETLSCSKKPRIEASPSSEDIEKYTIFTVRFLDPFMIIMSVYYYTCLCFTEVKGRAKVC